MRSLFLFGVLLMNTMACAPSKTRFEGKNKVPSVLGRDSSYSQKRGSFSVPPPAPEECVGTMRATRIVYVVDNSGSHAASIGATGSDPVVTAMSARGVQESLTQRQNAVWSTIVRTVESDAAAKQSNNKYPGSEIGVVAFPLDASSTGYAMPIVVSGPGGKASSVFPSLMNKALALEPNDAFKNGLWESLEFTHQSQGATPYMVGLQNAKKLFDSGTNDARLKVVVFITDGIPTDRSPQAVANFANTELGDAVIITVFVYTPGVTDLKTTPAYTSLGEAWKTLGWGKESGATSFDGYWDMLRKIPLTKNEGGMSSHLVEVKDATMLKAELEKVLGVVQGCGP
jgi:hypothetical protein